MNFEFSDELIQLRDQAPRFLAGRCPPAVPRRILDTDELYAADPVAGIFEEALLYSPALRPAGGTDEIIGGTDEIMKNIIAERVLGLPQDPRADKGLPFRDIPTGARK